MSLNSYTPVGPLTDETYYIKRQADEDILRHVRSMEYIMIIEPRQQGKTSLIRHLMSTPSLTEWSFVYVDISTLDTNSERAWYQELCRRICMDLKAMLLEISPVFPRDSVEWREFLSEIAVHACQAGKKIVIILDEIGGARFDNNILFFKTLREVDITRKVHLNCEFQNLSFVLVGSFNPSDLIPDSTTSPFNAAQHVHISDFNVEQVQNLMIIRGWEKGQAQILAQQVYYWTSGQPYLTQLLCSYLNRQSTPSDVNIAKENLYSEDIINLPHVIKGLKANNDLIEYISRIEAGESISYRPNIYSWQDRLFLLGLIKASQEGLCSIRNRIYENIIHIILEANTDTVSNNNVQNSRPTSPSDRPEFLQTTNKPDSIVELSEQQVDFVLVTALEEEQDAVLKKLPGYKRLKPIKGDTLTYYEAFLPARFPGEKKPSTYHIIIMPLLGMGRVKSASSAADAIRRWHPRYMLMVGIAGGLGEQDVNLGDILIADQIVDYESQKLTPFGPQIRWEVHRSDPQLLSACRAFRSNRWHVSLRAKRPSSGNPKRHFGPIASGDKVIAFGEVLAKYRDTWPKLIGVEMEAAGVATAAFQSAEKPGFFMVRCVSDLADENKEMPDVEKWRSYACDVAASYAIALLKNGPVTSER